MLMLSVNHYWYSKPWHGSRMVKCLSARSPVPVGTWSNGSLTWINGPMSTIQEDPEPANFHYKMSHKAAEDQKGTDERLHNPRLGRISSNKFTAKDPPPQIFTTKFVLVPSQIGTHRPTSLTSKSASVQIDSRQLQFTPYFSQTLMWILSPSKRLKKKQIENLNLKDDILWICPLWFQLA